ncbi:MAG TPA: hypothetical protein VF158_12890 [Longimicrobiales bacterium]
MSGTGKSARKSAPGRPFRKGHDPRRGRGPKPGAPNAGRPPDEFKATLARLASRDETLDYLRRCLDGEFGPDAYMKAVQWAAERGYGKVPAEVNAKVSGKLEVVIRDE